MWLFFIVIYIRAHADELAINSRRGQSTHDVNIRRLLSDLVRVL